MTMIFELEFLNRLDRDLHIAGVRASRRRPQILAIRVGATAAVALALVLVGLATLPWGSGNSSAAAAIEQRLRGLEVVHGANGDTLDTSQATILGSAGGLYLITGMRLVSGIDGQCAGVLAPRSLDDSFSRLPSSDLYFGDYTCADDTGGGGGTAILRLGDGGTGLVGSVADTVSRVTITGPSGAVDLPLHDGWYGTVVPYGQPAPTGVTEYDAGGKVTGSYTLHPQYFAKGYVPPTEASPHSTLIAKALPDGRPITVERTDVDRFGAYAFFLTIGGQALKPAQWGVDGPVPTKPDFWTDEVLAEGDARVLLIGTQAGATVTAALDDGTAVPVQVEQVGPSRGVALVVLAAAQATGKLTITGTAPDGSSLKSDTVDLPTAKVVALHEMN
jgi:hypothetical protein